MTKLDKAAYRREIDRERAGIGNTAFNKSEPAATSPPSWQKPEPLPLGTIPVDPFDYEFLPVALRGWVNNISDRLQCPPDYVAVAERFIGDLLRWLGRVIDAARG